jgi:23S rRNA pseudouridine2604 synthase
VALLAGATATEIEPATILLHKPANLDAVAAFDLITADNQEGRERFLKRHLAKLTHVLPLEMAASGLLVFTQHGGLARKLADKTQPYEQEYLVDVSGQMPEGGLALLNRGLKVSWQTPTRLRFAGKGIVPGQVEKLCRSMGLQVSALRRTRIGRIAVTGLQPGQWRYLNERERF